MVLGLRREFVLVEVAFASAMALVNWVDRRDEEIHLDTDYTIKSIP